MYISRLGLTNFRSFRKLDMEIPKGAVILFGGNAQGKTSLLEAMYLLAIAKSFRAENEREVVSWKATTEDTQALVNGTIEKEGSALNVIIGYQYASMSETVPRGSSSEKEGPDPLEGMAENLLRRAPSVLRKEIRVSRVKKSAAELVGLVNVVLFSAEDLQLIYGPPSLRRRYLDILLSQVDTTYLKSLQRYQRVLYQRNQLLKLLQTKRASEEELAFWDEGLIREGSYIVWTRHQAINTLFPLVQEYHTQLTGNGERLTLEYRPSSPLAASLEDVEQQFSLVLAQAKGRELRLGTTTVGPHRDDFKLLVEGVDMGTYASRGQARTLALTLRLAEAAYLASARDEEPILLLDDILSELDSFRRSRVLETALKYQQAIVTATELEPFTQSFLAKATVFRVKEGQVTLSEDTEYINS